MQSNIPPHHPQRALILLQTHQSTLVVPEIPSFVALCCFAFLFLPELPSQLLGFQSILQLRHGNKLSRAKHKQHESPLVLMASCSARNLEQNLLLVLSSSRTSSEFLAWLRSRSSCSRYK